MINRLIKWLNQNAINNYTSVELSVGKIYLKPLTNGIVNKITTKSCIVGDVLNDGLFFQLMDYELANLSKKRVDSLSVPDGKLLRDKIKEVLMENKVISVDSGIPKEDKLKLDSMKLKVEEETKKWQSART